MYAHERPPQFIFSEVVCFTTKCSPLLVLFCARRSIGSWNGIKWILVHVRAMSFPSTNPPFYFMLLSYLLIGILINQCDSFFIDPAKQSYTLSLDSRQSGANYFDYSTLSERTPVLSYPAEGVVQILRQVENLNEHLPIGIQCINAPPKYSLADVCHNRLILKNNH